MSLSAKPQASIFSRRMMWAAIACLLALPAVAMLFTPEVRWGFEDFAAAAFLLGAVGAGAEWTARARLRPASRAALLIPLLLVVALIWAQAAVGIF